MNKRKLMLVAVSLCMVAILGFGGTLAYLTDTDNQVNKFVTGNVDLKLDEELVKKDETTDSPTYGDFIASGAGRTEENQEYAKVFPGNEILKDPTITLLTGSENAWVAAKVVIKGTGVYDLFGIEGSDNIDITTKVNDKQIFSGGLLDKVTTAGDYKGLTGYGDDDCFIVQQADKANNTWTLFVYMKKAFVADEDVVLFNKVSIPDSWDNGEMIAFNNTTIDITAYAVQADGFFNCPIAMDSAFGTNGVKVNAGFPAVTDGTAD